MNQAAPVTQTIDEKIGRPTTYIRLVNSDNRLDEPIYLEDALHAIDRRECYILQVAGREQGRIPICKVINKKEQHLQQRDRGKGSRPKKLGLKKMELNWAIDAHDLSRQLKQLTNFLEQGRKVELTLKKKPGKRHPTLEEINHLMENTRNAIHAADAVQAKEVKGDPGKQLVMIVKKRGT